MSVRRFCQCHFLFPNSTEYWFRVLDIDGDGYLSFYELEYFYGEMLEKMENLGIEGLPLEDSMCQVMPTVYSSQGLLVDISCVEQT